jgi:phosphoglycerate dehydrogenase-like enzyme
VVGSLKLLLHKSALARVERELKASGLALELYVADEDGTVRRNGETVEPSALKPEIIWGSIDTFMGPTMRLFMNLARNEPSVRWMQTFSAGLDAPAFKQIYDRGVKISNSSAQAVAIAEYVLAHVLAEWHPIAEQRAAQAAREWRRIRFREVAGSRWLIVGYGNIGREIARRAKAFGVHITGVKRSPGLDEFTDAIGRLDDLPGLLPAADVVVLAVALNDTTRDLAGPKFFAAMQPGSFLVNIGRGDLVDEAALLAALDRDAPARAILDVFREEPLPTTSPFWAHPKVRLTGHTSAAGSGMQGRGDRLFLGNLQRFAKGETLVNQVSERTF